MLSFGKCQCRSHSSSFSPSETCALSGFCSSISTLRTLRLVRHERAPLSTSLQVVVLDTTSSFPLGQESVVRYYRCKLLASPRRAITAARRWLAELRARKESKKERKKAALSVGLSNGRLRAGLAGPAGARGVTIKVNGSWRRAENGLGGSEAGTKEAQVEEGACRSSKGQHAAPRAGQQP